MSSSDVSYVSSSESEAAENFTRNNFEFSLDLKITDCFSLIFVRIRAGVVSLSIKN